jgi:hypothetical protein
MGDNRSLKDKLASLKSSRKPEFLTRPPEPEEEEEEYFDDEPPETAIERRMQAETSYTPSSLFTGWDKRRTENQRDASKAHTDMARDLLAIGDMQNKAYEQRFGPQRFRDDLRRSKEKADLEHEIDKHLSGKAAERDLDLQSYKSVRSSEESVAIQMRLEESQARNRIMEKRAESEDRIKEHWEQANVQIYLKREELDLKMKEMRDALDLAISYKGLIEERKQLELIKMKDEVIYQIYQIRESEEDPWLKEQMIAVRTKFLERIEGHTNERGARSLEAHNGGDVRGNNQVPDRREHPWNRNQAASERLPAHPRRRKPKR